MKRKLTAFSIIWILLFSIIECISTTDALAAQKNGLLITLTQPEQVLDTITFQGITVDAIYTNAAHSGSDPVYSCAAFVKKFYQQVYGINVYNLHSSVSTPLIYDNKGSFIVTEEPQIGDIVRDNTRTHWAIVKDITEDTVTLIQQNYRSGTKAWTGCTIDKKGTGYTFFTYSERVPDTSLPQAPQLPDSIQAAQQLTDSMQAGQLLTDSSQAGQPLTDSMPQAQQLPSSMLPAQQLPDSLPPAPQLKETSKTLYTGFQDYSISLEQLAEDALIYYSSAKPEIATVSSDGIIIPIQTGNTIIHINVIQNNVIYESQLQITVKDPYLKLSASNKELAVGELVTVKAKKYGTKDAISWQVSDKKIATINKKTGELKAMKKGTVTVTAKTATGLSAKLKIKVI